MNKEIWEKNLQAMEKWYPAFANMLREKQTIEEDVEILSEQSWDGERIFRLKKGDRVVYLNGKRKAKKPVQMWVERIGKLPKYTPVFLFGIGGGAYLKALSGHTDKEVNIILYEPSAALFLSVLKEVDLSKEIADRPIAFLVEGINEEEFEPILGKVLVFENINFFREEIHPNYQNLYPGELLKMFKILEKRITQMRAEVHTGMNFHKDTVRNILQNMKYICEGYHTQNLSEVIPYDGAAILVAAGPSLNKNIMELKNAKNKAFILAVDTAVKPLMRAGIVPDAFITIDPKKPLDLINIEGVEQIPIIAPTAARTELLEHQKGKKIFFFDGYLLPMQMYVRVHKGFPDVSSGGSVACNGFSLLYKMGFDIIILVGQDLAYSDNKSHADGTFQEEMPEENTEGMITVKGNYQDKVPTLPNLKIYLEWFNMYVEGCKKYRNVRVINATEGGAFIEGTELRTLKDIIAEVCKEENNFEERIAQMESSFTEEEKKVAVEYLHTIPAQFGEIMKDARQLKSLYGKLEKIGKSGNIDKNRCMWLLAKIQKLTDKCHEKETYQLVQTTIQAAENIVRGEFFFEEDNEKEEIREMSRKGVLYSELLLECAELLKGMAEETLLPIKA